MIKERLNLRLILFKNEYYYFDFLKTLAVQKIIINDNFEIVDIKNGSVNATGISDERCRFVFNEETIEFYIGDRVDYIRKYKDSIDFTVGQELFYAIYTENEIGNVSGYGFEETLNRFSDSYLVIFENTGNKRFVYKNGRILFTVPDFSDGPMGGVQLRFVDNLNYIIDSKQNDQLSDVEEMKYLNFDEDPNAEKRKSYEITIFYKNCIINQDF